jgi:hypothetical protein
MTTNMEWREYNYSPEYQKIMSFFRKWGFTPSLCIQRMHTSFYIRKKHQGLTRLQQRSNIRSHHLSETRYTYKTDEGGDHGQGPLLWPRTNAHHRKAGGLAKSPNRKQGASTSPADPQHAPTHALSKVAGFIFLILIFRTGEIAFL